MEEEPAVEPEAPKSSVDEAADLNSYIRDFSARDFSLAALLRAAAQQEQKKPVYVPKEPAAEEPEKTVKAYSRADLRKVLMKAKKSGVNLNDIFEQYGASGVNDIPESYYAEIIQRFGGV